MVWLESYPLFVQIFTTAALFVLNVTKGLMFSIPGPTLLALTEIANTTIGHSTWIFLFRGCGVVIGSVLGGYASRHRTLALGTSIVVASLTFGAVPWCTDVHYMYILFAVYGLSYGCISATMNYFLLQLWGEHSPPIFSACVACFFGGATIAPIIDIPFLPKGKHDVLHRLSSELNQGHNMTPTSAWTTDVEFHSHSSGNITGDFSYTDAPLANLSINSLPSERIDPVRELYIIITACGLFSALVVTVGSVLSSRVGLAKQELSESRKQNLEIVDDRLSRYFFIIFCLLYQVFLFGMMFVFAGLIASYMVEGLGGTPRDGTLITSLFWGVYTVVAMLGIGLARSFTPSTILLCDNIMLTAGAVTLMCGYDSWKLVWVGTALLAVGFGPAYATIFLWGDYYITLTRALTGILVAAPEIGGIIMPAIEGQLFSNHPGSLMVMVFVLSIACDITYVLTESIAFPFRRKANKAIFGWKRSGPYEPLIQ